MNNTSLKLQMTRKALPLVLLCSMSLASAFELGLEKISLLGGKKDGAAALIATVVTMCGLKDQVTRSRMRTQGKNDFVRNIGIATCANAFGNVALDDNMNPLAILTAACLNSGLSLFAETQKLNLTNSSDLFAFASYFAAKYGIEGVKSLISSN